MLNKSIIETNLEDPVIRKGFDVVGEPFLVNYSPSNKKSEKAVMINYINGNLGAICQLANLKGLEYDAIQIMGSVPNEDNSVEPRMPNFICVAQLLRKKNGNERAYQEVRFGVAPYMSRGKDGSLNY